MPITLRKSYFVICLNPEIKKHIRSNSNWIWRIKEKTHWVWVKVPFLLCRL